MKSARNQIEIGKLIKYHRQKSGLSQKELAQKSGLTQVTISKIENGIGGTLKALDNILNALKCEVLFQKIQNINTENILDLLE